METEFDERETQSGETGTDPSCDFNDASSDESIEEMIEIEKEVRESRPTDTSPSQNIVFLDDVKEKVTELLSPEGIYQEGVIEGFTKNGSGISNESISITLTLRVDGEQIKRTISHTYGADYLTRLEKLCAYTGVSLNNLANLRGESVALTIPDKERRSPTLVLPKTKNNLTAGIFRKGTQILQNNAIRPSLNLVQLAIPATLYLIGGVGAFTPSLIPTGVVPTEGVIGLFSMLIFAFTMISSWIFFTFSTGIIIYFALKKAREQYSPV